MPNDIVYDHASPFYVWCIFMLYNWFQSNFGLYGLLNAVLSLDYRILLILLNAIGLYMFLRHVRIDFTVRMAMNMNEH